MKIVNYTPHIVRLNDGREYPPSGRIARVSSTYEVDGDGWYRTRYGAPVGLPEPMPDTYLIVSGMLASVCQDRSDLIAPATGHPDAVRKDGQVFSVPGFVRNNG